MRKGSNHHSAKLNERSVSEIRQRHAAGETQRRLARVFGVSQPAINKAVNGSTYSHVPIDKHTK